MFEQKYEELMLEGAPTPFRLPSWIACAPFEEYLGMRIDEAAEGKAVLSMPFKVKLAQGAGLMHGGAVTALADTAVAIAIKTLLPEGSNFATTELSLKFHAPIRGGTAKAVAEARREGDRTIIGAAEVFDGKGTKAASFSAVFRIKK